MLRTGAFLVVGAAFGYLTGLCVAVGSRCDDWFGGSIWAEALARGVWFVALIVGICAVLATMLFLGAAFAAAVEWLEGKPCP